MSVTLNVLKGIKPLFKRGETFKCYHDFGCFQTEQEAYNDAQIEADRHIY